MLFWQKRLAKKIVLVFLFAPLFVLAFSSPGAPVGFVNDYAGLMSVEQKLALENKIAAFKKDTGNEIAVATIKTLDGDTIENFSNELFKEWGVGKKEKDNGILILVALDERKMRIEVGYGLEGNLTDAQSYQIIDKIMKPAFREEDYYKGINGAVDQIIAITKGENPPIEVTEKQTIFRVLSEFSGWLVYGFLFFFVWLASILARSKSWWAGGIIGGIVGFIIALFTGFILTGIIAIMVLTPLGLFFDYIVSRTYKESKKHGRKVPWWAGGGGKGGWGGGSSGGGFGGGGSGGGGSSGSW